jgi:Spondin_N
MGFTHDIPTNPTMLRSVLFCLAAALPVAADIVYNNEEIKTEEIFDLDYAKDSEVSVYQNDGLNETYYYCTFRSNWNKENHPSQYPDLARWSSPLMFSHTKQYAPYLKNLKAPYGIEQIAEVRQQLSRASRRCHT